MKAAAAAAAFRKRVSLSIYLSLYTLSFYVHGPKELNYSGHKSYARRRDSCTKANIYFGFFTGLMAVGHID